jgi:hypothetical protein
VNEELEQNESLNDLNPELDLSGIITLLLILWLYLTDLIFIGFFKFSMLFFLSLSFDVPFGIFLTIVNKSYSVDLKTFLIDSLFSQNLE